MVMRSLAFVLVIACGGKQTPPPNDDPPVGVAKDTRTPIEKRRDTACDQVGDRIVACAVADAKADLAAGHVGNEKFDKAQFDKDTAPAILHKAKDEWLKVCRTPKTSHQVRVLEVCLKEETECGPFTDCLQHINDELKK